ncbi:hypothetical protein [Runella sp.]|uniref:hypothetical protein n=1 Tax=Runella sp. TaxID=1960881 RepID=UPI003D11A261
MKYQYEEKTLVGILQDLKERGYTLDFGTESSEEFMKKVTLAEKRHYAPATTDTDPHLVDLYVREVHRLEGMSDPSDNTIIYAIETAKGDKGFLINAYGVYSEDKQVEKEAITPQEISPEQTYDNNKTDEAAKEDNEIDVAVV